MMAELEKLEVNLGGVADMKSVPDAVFVIDLRKEQLAVREARRLGLPVIALVDTNCDPDDADYVIPGNDDAIRSCSLIVRVIANAIEAGKSKVTAEEMAAPQPPAEEPQPQPEPEQRAGGRRRRAGSRLGARSGRRGRGGAPVSTTVIPAGLVKELRDLTGAGMMDCKRALVESGGDLEAARKALREQGLAEAGKRAGRETSEGKVVVASRRRRWRHRRGRLRDGAGVRHRGVPGVRPAPARRRLGGRARPRRTRSRTSGSSWSRGSARTSSSSGRSATRPARARWSPTTSIRRRRRSACS